MNISNVANPLQREIKTTRTHYREPWLLNEHLSAAYHIVLLNLPSKFGALTYEASWDGIPVTLYTFLV